MRIMLINPPYQTLTSNFGVGHQMPLGLLMVGGPLLDAGHQVRLLDAECRRLSMRKILREVAAFGPDVVMTGHAGSTPAHPVCMELLTAIKAAHPLVKTIYGGVYPSHHAEEILRDPAVDFIIRGEGEATALELIETLNGRRAPGLTEIHGLAFRRDGRVCITPTRAPIQDLDAFRVGWKLIEDWDAYGCFGMGRAAVVQMSRGCPHRCTYCGQFSFWLKWRHRDPVKFADEIEWLYREHDVRFFTIADENPTTLRDVWRTFLEELAARDLPVHLFATIRATDIVRDAELLPLYRRAGMLYVLMGIESTNEEVIRQIKKGSTTRHDFLASRLLKEHGIFTILGHIVGLEHETWQSFRLALAHLLSYEGTWLNAMYATPHSWTPFYKAMREQGIVQLDQRKWDYRHQIFAQKHLKPWQVFVAVKWLEFRFHIRVGRLWELLRERDPFRRRQLLWCLIHTGTVWLAEIAEFLLFTRYAAQPPKLATVERESQTLPEGVSKQAEPEMVLETIGDGAR